MQKTLSLLAAFFAVLFLREKQKNPFVSPTFFASHQCYPGLIPGPGILHVCGLCLLVVFVLAMRVFLRVIC